MTHERPEKLPPVEVRRGAFARLTIYEVEEGELEILARGSPDSLYLNFSIFLLSIASGFLITLITAEVSDRVFTIFVCITAIGFLLGVFLLILWFRNRRSVSLLVQKIKDRLPPDAFQLFDDLSEEEINDLVLIEPDEKLIEAEGVRHDPDESP